MQLNNKVVIVTGSTAGIGVGIAKHCVAQGAKVMIHGREENKAKQLCQELGVNANYFISDLADTSQYHALMEHTLTQFGRLDGLVNNAGIYPRNTIDRFDEQFFDRLMTINVKAPLFLSQQAVAIFRQQGSAGSIVNIGSINAYCGQKDLLIYAMSKGALMSMTRNLADALSEENIRVNLLNVGWTVTETEVALKRSEGLADDWEKDVPKFFAPTGKLLRPDDIAHHVVFWLSSFSAPVTGAVYEVEQYPIIGRNLIPDIQKYFSSQENKK